MMMLRKFCFAAALLSLGLVSGAQAQQGVSLASGFTDFTSWHLSGSATAANTVQNGFSYSSLQLTTAGQGGQGGAGFAPTALTLDFNQAFNFDFHFFISAGTVLRGDGLTFTLAGAAPTASGIPEVGGAGSDLGYGGISNSLAFAVDTFHFDGEPVSPSLQILRNGSASPLAFTQTGLGDNIRDPLLQYYATVSFTPSGNNDESGILKGSIFHPAFGTFSVSSAVDLSQLGVALDMNGDPLGHRLYYGFTAANGLADDGHFITSAVLVPEPSTYAMLMAGVATLVFVARRRLTQWPLGA